VLIEPFYSYVAATAFFESLRTVALVLVKRIHGLFRKIMERYCEYLLSSVSLNFVRKGSRYCTNSLQIGARRTGKPWINVTFFRLREKKWRTTQERSAFDIFMLLRPLPTSLNKEEIPVGLLISERLFFCTACTAEITNIETLHQRKCWITFLSIDSHPWKLAHSKLMTSLCSL